MKRLYGQALLANAERVGSLVSELRRGLSFDYETELCHDAVTEVMDEVGRIDGPSPSVCQNLAEYDRDAQTKLVAALQVFSRHAISTAHPRFVSVGRQFLVPREGAAVAAAAAVPPPVMPVALFSLRPVHKYDAKNELGVEPFIAADFDGRVALLTRLAKITITGPIAASRTFVPNPANKDGWTQISDNYSRGLIMAARKQCYDTFKDVTAVAFTDSLCAALELVLISESLS